MLILLDRKGLVVGTLDYDEPPDTVLITELGTFEYEDQDGDDFVYRLVDP